MLEFQSNHFFQNKNYAPRNRNSQRMRTKFPAQKGRLPEELLAEV